MKTKRIFALLLAALMIVGLFAGCSKDGTKDPGKTDPGNSLIDQTKPSQTTAKQMQLVGAGLCSARQDTLNYRKSSANPYALTCLAVEADAGHSRSRRRSVTDVGLPLAGTHRTAQDALFLR